MKNYDFALEDILFRSKTEVGYTDNDAIAEIKELFGVACVKPLLQRKREFKDELRPFLKEYHEAMIVNFFEYWTEHSLKGRLLRFEKENTWDTKRRLARWAENQKKFSIAGIMAKRVNS